MSKDIIEQLVESVRRGLLNTVDRVMEVIDSETVVSSTGEITRFISELLSKKLLNNYELTAILTRLAIGIAKSLYENCKEAGYSAEMCKEATLTLLVSSSMIAMEIFDQITPVGEGG